MCAWGDDAEDEAADAESRRTRRPETKENIRRRMNADARCKMPEVGRVMSVRVHVRGGTNRATMR